MAENLSLFGNRILQSAIRNNRVSFPSQALVFVKQQGGEIQARLAHLYFVSGWSISDLAARYAMTSETVRKSLNDWRIRAIASGYIQEIDLDRDDHPVVEVSTGWCNPKTIGPEVDERDEDLKPFSIVPRTTLAIAPGTRVAGVSNSKSSAGNVRKQLMNEIETGSSAAARWPAFCLRLLGMLRQECRRLGFQVAAAQIDRIEATEERDAELARHLLGDLRVRISDEEWVSGAIAQADDHTPALLRALTAEVELSQREAMQGDDSASALWPAHCSRLLAIVRNGCAILGLRLTAAQVGRIEDAVASDRGQLSHLLRDLGNRMLDEMQWANSVDAPAITQRALTAGGGRR
jgi:hypothetical protein